MVDRFYLLSVVVIDYVFQLYFVFCWFCLLLKAAHQVAEHYFWLEAELLALPVVAECLEVLPVGRVRLLLFCAPNRYLVLSQVYTKILPFSTENMFVHSFVYVELAVGRLESSQKHLFNSFPLDSGDGLQEL